MFLLNRGSSVKVDSSLNINGIVTTATGLPMEQLQRQKNFPKSGIILFDPQLHFPHTLKNNCYKTFTKLSSYPWFNPNHPEYDSQYINITEYRKILATNLTGTNINQPTSNAEIEGAISSCLEFQRTLNVSYYILPTPLVKDSDDCFTEQIKWIESALSLNNYNDKPKLISLCISDSLLNSRPVDNNTLLQTILDNLTTYDQIDGFYINIQRSDDCHYITDRNVILSILELSYFLGRKMNKLVFFNSIDTLGFLALSVGASAIISGYTNKEKRLYFNDYIDKTGGGALPHFYSFSLIGDLRSSRDMLKINSAGLLDFVKNDTTTFSDELFNALENNIDISKTSWKESKNNVTKAKLHRYQLLSNKANIICSLSDENKIKFITNWLYTAKNKVNEFNSVHSSNGLEQDFSHINIWINCYNNFISKYNLL